MNTDHPNLGSMIQAASLTTRRLGRIVSAGAAFAASTASAIRRYGAASMMGGAHRERVADAARVIGAAAPPMAVPPLLALAASIDRSRMDSGFTAPANGIRGMRADARVAAAGIVARIATNFDRAAIVLPIRVGARQLELGSVRNIAAPAMALPQASVGAASAQSAMREESRSASRGRLDALRVPAQLALASGFGAHSESIANANGARRLGAVAVALSPVSFETGRVAGGGAAPAKLSAGAITLNSAPTIVINAPTFDASLEARVVAALRRARGEVFDQLNRERAVRERQEF